MLSPTTVRSNNCQVRFGNAVGRVADKEAHLEGLRGAGDTGWERCSSVQLVLAIMSLNCDPLAASPFSIILRVWFCRLGEWEFRCEDYLSQIITVLKCASEY